MAVKCHTALNQQLHYTQDHSAPQRGGPRNAN